MHTSTFYTYLSMNRWFGVTLDWTITVYSAICVFSFLLIDDGETFPFLASQNNFLSTLHTIYILLSLGFSTSGSQSGYVGVVLTACLNMVGMMQWGLRQSAVMENTMTSVERIVEYGQLQSEAELARFSRNYKISPFVMIMILTGDPRRL